VIVPETVSVLELSQVYTPATAIAIAVSPVPIQTLRCLVEPGLGWFIASSSERVC